MNNGKRILDEGYGPSAWHGPNMLQAVADVTAELAYWRPAPERHNIAELALHHAFYVHSVRGRILGTEIEPFVAPGEDFTPLPGASGLDWPRVQAELEEQQHRLVALVEDIEAGRVKPALSQPEIFDLVLGITCHAAYHAGQIQLLKRLG